jgi:hypothetical protein
VNRAIASETVLGAFNRLRSIIATGARGHSDDWINARTCAQQFAAALVHLGDRAERRLMSRSRPKVEPTAIAARYFHASRSDITRREGCPTINGRLAYCRDATRSPLGPPCPEQR